MYHLIVGLTRPYTLLFLLTGLALANLWRRRRDTRRRLLLVAVPFAGLAILSLPAVAYAALASLEWRYPPTLTRPEEAEAIVVLSGSVVQPDAMRSRAILGESSLYRCLHAADMYRAGPPVPVILTGGKVDPDEPGEACAPLMAEFLRELGLPAADLLVEGNARSTYENAVETRRLLQPRGLRTILLVTEATHMPRAELCFRRQGFAVIPSACRHRATEFDPSLFDFLPTPSAASNCLEAAHEWMGFLWYKMMGKF